MKKYRIGIICDQFGNLQRGGAEMQVDNTFDALRKNNLLEVEYVDRNVHDLSRYDLVHFFKSNFEYFPIAASLKEKGIPYVVSTIIFPKYFFIEVLIYKMSSLLPSKICSLFSISRRVFLWKNAAFLFPNTKKEADFVSKISKNRNIQVIPNGLNMDEMRDVSSAIFTDKYSFLLGKRFVLNVARVEKRKNQKKLVIACKNLDLPIVIIGKIWDNEYYKEITNLNYSKCYFLGPIYDRNLLFSSYAACAVFCLPSTVETPGIAAMEAAYYNVPVVLTKNGGTDYYFKDKVYYVDWRNVKDIENGISEMLTKKVDTRDLMTNYSWDSIADMYVDLYKDICD